MSKVVQRGAKGFFDWAATLCYDLEEVWLPSFKMANAKRVTVTANSKKTAAFPTVGLLLMLSWGAAKKQGIHARAVFRSALLGLLLRGARG